MQQVYWTRCRMAAELLDLEISVVRRAWNIIEPVSDLLHSLPELRQELRDDVLRRYPLCLSSRVLSMREFEVLVLLSEGVRAKEVARRLELNPKSITEYRKRLLNKLGLSTNIDLVRYVDRLLAPRTCFHCGAEMTS